MAWTTIETPNAKYVLLFSFHSKKSENVPEAFDALVLESSGLKPGRTIYSDQYEKVVNQAVERGKKIWLTDTQPNIRSELRMGGGILALGGTALPGALLLRKAKNEGITRRAFIKGGIAIGLLTPIPSVIVMNKLKSHEDKIKRLKTWDVSTRISDLIHGVGITTARNLITAEKCESFLAPRLQQELGRKPTIAMVWHPGHYGIRNLLLHPKKRERLLRKYDLTKFVRNNYPESFKIHLAPDGTIDRVEKFNETLRPRRTESVGKKAGTLSRRDFMARIFGRRRKG